MNQACHYVQLRTLIYQQQGYKNSEEEDTMEAMKNVVNRIISNLNSDGVGIGWLLNKLQEFDPEDSSTSSSCEQITKEVQDI